MALAQHLDDLQEQLGEKVRNVLGVDLWQAVRDGGQLKLETETQQGAFNTVYATVSGYRLIDPARKKLVPALHAAIKAFDAIGYFDVKVATDAERTNAARLFSRGLGIIRETFEDIMEFRQFLSVQTIATIRNWAQQENAPARLYIRREGLSILVGRSVEKAREIRLKPVVDVPVPLLPSITTTV